MDINELLAIYKRDRPDVFSRLPLPKELAKELGVPVSDEVVHLNTYLRAFLQVREEPIENMKETKALSIESQPIKDEDCEGHQGEA